jgi:hypothetical protein
MTNNIPENVMIFQTNQYEARIQWLSDEVLRLAKLLSAEQEALKEEKQVNMTLCSIIERLERSKKSDDAK